MAAFPMNDRRGDDLRQMFGPHQIDEMIRQAISTCWILLPDDKRTIDELEKQIRRIVDRSLKSMRDDAASFETG